MTAKLKPKQLELFEYHQTSWMAHVDGVPQKVLVSPEYFEDVAGKLNANDLVYVRDKSRGTWTELLITEGGRGAIPSIVVLREIKIP